MRKIRVLAICEKWSGWSYRPGSRVSMDIPLPEREWGCCVWEFVFQPNVGLKRTGVNTDLVQ